MRALPPPESAQPLDDAAFWRKLRGLPVRVVQRALLLYAVLAHRGTPAWARALVVFALAYLINPLDAVPDALVGIGLADDLIVMGLALERLSRFVTPEVRAAAATLVPRAFPGGHHRD
jgi:uncharacterized membrane protein YkvA (DUF1232 family)